MFVIYPPIPPKIAYILLNIDKIKTPPLLFSYFCEAKKSIRHLLCQALNQKDIQYSIITINLIFTYALFPFSFHTAFIMFLQNKTNLLFHAFMRNTYRELLFQREPNYIPAQYGLGFFPW